MSNSEYLAQFNEKDVINAFTEIIKADSPSISFANRDVDLLDVEMFLDDYCVAIGLAGIADLIVSEYNKREEKYFGCVKDAAAKEMALSALKEHFLYNRHTMYKADSPFASAFDWLGERYKLLEIPLGMDGTQVMILAFDFNNAKFDVDHYIGPSWLLHYCENARIINIVNKKINK